MISIKNIKQHNCDKNVSEHQMCVLQWFQKEITFQNIWKRKHLFKIVIIYHNIKKKFRGEKKIESLTHRDSLFKDSEFGFPPAYGMCAH